MASESKKTTPAIPPELTDQHILMSSLPYILLNWSGDGDVPKLSWKHFITADNTRYEQGPPQRLLKDKQEDLSAILKMNNMEIASLIPKIQFWKVITEPNTGEIIDEIYIPYSYSAKNYVGNIFGNRQNRGDDVGIKNVSFVYDNQNPAVAETLLGCTIDFVFDNAEALIIQRGTKKRNFRYVDLFAFEQTTSNNKIDRGKYDIIMKVGYEIDGVMEIQSQEVRDALKKQERMIRLGMTGYDLTFRPNGMLNVTVEYKSANVDYFSDNRNEVLGLKEALKPSPNPAQAAKEQVLKKAGVPSPDEAANAPGDATKKEIDLQSLYSRIQTYMANNLMINDFDAAIWRDLVYSGEFKFSTNPCVSSGNNFKEDVAKEMLPVGDVTEAGIAQSAYETAYTGSRRVSYFLFGDLLEALLATNPGVFEEMKKRRFAFLLDNVGYQYEKGGQVSIFNVSLMPIAQRSFDDWFQKNVIDKKIKVYSLMDFMKNMILNFLSGILSVRTLGDVGIDYAPSLVRQLITVPNGLKDNKNIFGTTQLSPIEGGSSYSKTAKNSYYEYYTIYDEAYYNDKISLQADNLPEEDLYFYNLVSGIPHFYIGADKGLLKTFNFQKSNIGEQIAVIRNLEEGNPFQQLWSIFDVNLEFIGNNLMSVGKMIYLDPSITGLGSPYKKGTVSNLMGLGGYYMITYVRHDYYPKWTTSVNAISIVPASQKKTYSAEDVSTSFVYY